MYTHDKNKRLAAYLKRKAGKPEGEQQEDDSLPVINRTEPKRVQVFDVEQLGAIKDAHSKSSNQYKNINRVLTQIEGTDGYLQLVELPDSIFDDLDALANRFPNFSGVIDYYKQEFALARLARNPIFNAQPLLIEGLPGSGKTAFCHEIAKLVNTHFEFINMSCLTAGFVLSGSSSKWGESNCGKVVQSLAKGRRANPLIVADEIDKIGGDSRYDPLGSFYALLEKTTASKFFY
jgi:ATP-dependent 26S proteasome regulatory subunit